MKTKRTCTNYSFILEKRFSLEQKNKTKTNTNVGARPDFRFSAVWYLKTRYSHIEPWHGISNNVVCATSKASDQPAHTRSLIRAFSSRLNILSVTLLTEHNLEFLSLKGGCTGLSEYTLVKMPHCWKSHVVAQIVCKI